MVEGGYIKLFRSITKWEWYDDPKTKALFIHLLLTVNIDDVEWHGITIKRGSRVTSYSKLANEMHFSIHAIRAHLQRLETTGEVARCSQSKYTIITVNNFDNYQSQRHNERQTNGTQEGKQTANKRQQDKKNKEDIRREEKSGSAAVDSSGRKKPAGMSDEQWALICELRR